MGDQITPAPAADLAAPGRLGTGGARRTVEVEVEAHLRLCWVSDGGWGAGVQGSGPAAGEDVAEVAPGCPLEVPPVSLSRLGLWRPNQNRRLKLSETSSGEEKAEKQIWTRGQVDTRHNL